MTSSEFARGRYQIADIQRKTQEIQLCSRVVDDMAVRRRAGGHETVFTDFTPPLGSVHFSFRSASALNICPKYSGLVLLEFSRDQLHMQQNYRLLIQR